MMQRVMHPQVCAKVTATEAVAPSAPCLSTAPTDFVTVAPDPAGGDGARSVTCHTCWPEAPHDPPPCTHDCTLTSAEYTITVSGPCGWQAGGAGDGVVG